MREEVAYSLDWELDHFENYQLDWQHDLVCQFYAGLSRSAIFDIERFETFGPLIYTGYPDIVRQIDYPFTNNGWPVMSRRMYNTLLAAGSFPHRALPVAVIDCRVPNSEWYDSQRKLREEITDRNFVAIQLTELLDIFDWQNAKYTVDEEQPDLIVDVEEYLFKLPETGLPPLFRIKGDTTPLFISALARKILKDANMSGPRYISLCGYQENGGDEVDVPVKLIERGS